MNWVKIILGILVIMGLASFLADKLSGSEPVQATGSIYDFKLKSLEGETIDFAQFKGKKLLLVNTASNAVKHHSMPICKSCMNSMAIK